MKRFLTAIALVVVVALVYVAVTIDNRIKEHIEETASHLAGVPVTVESVNVSFFQGKGRITGLTVGNPEGYTEDFAFSVDAMEVAMDSGTLFSQPLVIHSLLIEAPKVNLEFREDLTTNLQDIVAVSNRQIYGNSEGKSKKSDGAGGEDGQEEQADDSAQQGQAGNEAQPGQGEPGQGDRRDGGDDDYRMVVELLEIRDIDMSARLEDDQWTETLPTIRFEDIGAPRGVSTRVVGITVVRSLAKETFEQAAARAAAEAVKDKVNEVGTQLLESLLGE